MMGKHQYAVGDRVRYIEPLADGGMVTPGTLGTVTDVQHRPMETIVWGQFDPAPLPGRGLACMPDEIEPHST